MADDEARAEEIARGERYGKWRIYFDPPPIPIRTLDWTYVHDDYDGAEDSGDRRCGYAGSIEECKADIDEWEADNA